LPPTPTQSQFSRQGFSSCGKSEVADGLEQREPKLPCIVSLSNARGTPRRRRPAWPSQFGDFEVSVPASGSDRRWPRGQTETVENLASDGRILNSGQNTHPAAAARTFQHIHGENSRHQLGPAVIARMWLFFFGAVSMSAGFCLGRWRRGREGGRGRLRR